MSSLLCLFTAAAAALALAVANPTSHGWPPGYLQLSLYSNIDCSISVQSQSIEVNATRLQCTPFQYSHAPMLSLLVLDCDPGSNTARVHLYNASDCTGVGDAIYVSPQTVGCTNSAYFKLQVVAGQGCQGVWPPGGGDQPLPSPTRTPAPTQLGPGVAVLLYPDSAACADTNVATLSVTPGVCAAAPAINGSILLESSASPACGSDGGLHPRGRYAHFQYFEGSPSCGGGGTAWRVLLEHGGACAAGPGAPSPPVSVRLPYDCEKTQPSRTPTNTATPTNDPPESGLRVQYFPSSTTCDTTASPVTEFFMKSSYCTVVEMPPDGFSGMWLASCTNGGDLRINRMNTLGCGGNPTNWWFPLSECYATGPNSSVRAPSGEC